MWIKAKAFTVWKKYGVVVFGAQVGSQKVGHPSCIFVPCSRLMNFCKKSLLLGDVEREWIGEAARTVQSDVLSWGWLRVKAIPFFISGSPVRKIRWLCVCVFGGVVNEGSYTSTQLNSFSPWRRCWLWWQSHTPRRRQTTLCTEVPLHPRVAWQFRFRVHPPGPSSRP